MPATWIRTPLGGSIPQASRWKWLELVTRRRGTMSSSRTAAGPVEVGQEHLEGPDPLRHALLR